MSLVPRSLAGRLLAISALTTVVALVFAAVVIGNVLERFVIRGLDQQLDAQVTMLAGPFGRMARSTGRASSICPCSNGQAPAGAGGSKARAAAGAAAIRSTPRARASPRASRRTAGSEEPRPDRETA